MYDSRYSFNPDEIYCVRAASGSFSYMIQAIISDRTHPPLYYVLLYPWVKVVGSSEVAVRLLSVLASALFLFVISKLAFRLVGGFAAWCLVGICAVNGFLVYYGQEARPWAVSALSCTLSIWLLIRLDEHPQEKRYKVLYAASCAAVIYTHFLGLLFLIAQFLGVFFARLRSRGQILSYGLLGTSTIIPWLYVMGREVMPNSVKPNLGWIPRPTWADLPHLYMSVMERFSIHGTRYILMALTMLIMSSLLFYRNRINWSWAVLLIFVAVFPLAAAFVISRHAAVSVWAPRELIGPIVMIFCLLALGLAAHRRGIALIFGSSLIVCSILTLPTWLPHNISPDWQLYAAAAREMCPRCPVYVPTVSDQIGLGYYSTQPVYAIDSHVVGGELRSLRYWLPNPPPVQDEPDNFLVMCVPDQCVAAAGLLHQDEVAARRQYKWALSKEGTMTLNVFLVSKEKDSHLSSGGIPSLQRN